MKKSYSSFRFKKPEQIIKSVDKKLSEAQLVALANKKSETSFQITFEESMAIKELIEKIPGYERTLARLEDIENFRKAARVVASIRTDKAKGTDNARLKKALGYLGLSPRKIREEQKITIKSDFDTLLSLIQFIEERNFSIKIALKLNAGGTRGVFPRLCESPKVLLENIFSSPTSQRERLQLIISELTRFHKVASYEACQKSLLRQGAKGLPNKPKSKTK